MDINSISQEKLDWMKKVGIKEFEEPMKYHVGLNHVYSEKYIAETPLSELKIRYNRKLIRWGIKDKLNYKFCQLKNILSNCFNVTLKAVFHKSNTSMG
jgi:hypothetical protein